MTADSPRARTRNRRGEGCQLRAVTCHGKPIKPGREATPVGVEEGLELLCDQVRNSRS